MFGAIGTPELIIVSVIALMMFGPAKFPDFRKYLSPVIRRLRKIISDVDECTVERSPSPNALQPRFQMVT
jgi:Sec-independent protein translocase protein TatA